MDARHFATLTRALMPGGSPRGLLGMLATLPLLGGMFTLLDAADMAAKSQRRKKHCQATSSATQQGATVASGTWLKAGPGSSRTAGTGDR